MPVNPGEVEIKLNGRDVVLRPTLETLLVVNAFGGILPAYDRLQKMDFNAYVAIIAAGLDKKPADIQWDVFKSDWTDFVEPLCELISNLTRGGRPKPKDGDVSGEA